MSLVSTELIILDFGQMENCNLQLSFARLSSGSAESNMTEKAGEKPVYPGQTWLIF